MPWTWVRPADPHLLDGRPLLDLGCGDAQTLAALVPARGLVVGLDRNPDALRAARRAWNGPLAAGEALSLPFRDGAFACVLAADLFHHVEDLPGLLAEIARVLGPGGTLVAWWYAEPATPAPDAPRFPRRYEEVASAAAAVGVCGPLSMDAVEGAGPVTGLVATRT